MGYLCTVLSIRYRTSSTGSFGFGQNLVLVRSLLVRVGRNGRSSPIIACRHEAPAVDGMNCAPAFHSVSTVCQPVGRPDPAARVLHRATPGCYLAHWRPGAPAGKTLQWITKDEWGARKGSEQSTTFRYIDLEPSSRCNHHLPLPVTTSTDSFAAEALNVP